MKTPTSTWYVYVLRCNDHSLYTGITTDLQRRLKEHNSQTKGAKYTRGRRPVELVYYEKMVCRSSASKREFVIKNLSSKNKRKLFN